MSANRHGALRPTTEDNVEISKNSKLKRRAVNLLKEISVCPSTSFHEEIVADYIKAHLRVLGIAPIVDVYGNVIAHYEIGRTKNKVAFVTHMDHPGLEVISVAGQTAVCRLLGGIAPEYLKQGIGVSLFSDGRIMKGTLERTEKEQTGTRELLHVSVNDRLAPGSFGVFDVESFRQAGDRVLMRAADDLIGCSAALLACEDLVSSRVEGDIYFVFTRGEEEGLLGATLLAQSGVIPKDVKIVSVECSRTMVGARSGHGLVVRTGDVRRTFDWSAESLLAAAQTSLPVGAGERARFQRQLMSGGVCEASAFQAQGYLVTGLAVPIVNYHNQGPRSTLTPESVSLNDFLTLIRLLNVLPGVIKSEPGDHLKSRLEELAAVAAKRLGGNMGQGNGSEK